MSGDKPQLLETLGECVYAPSRIISGDRHLFSNPLLLSWDDEVNYLPCHHQL
ncbi:hypothetical protein [Nostoc sp.]|uniref:hypothetical protein n=1 Tax=Nostoc sp. TaxID=1180 RepID=UPI002FF5C973